jgi:tape measure domain-containing protein
MSKDRELPPIRIRITGDSSDLDKAVKGVISKLSELQQKIKEAASASANASIVAEQKARDELRRDEEKHKVRIAAMEQQNVIKYKAAISKAKAEIAAIDKQAQVQHQRVQNQIANDDKAAKLEQQRIQASTNNEAKKAQAEINRIQRKSDLDKIRAQNTINNQNRMATQRFVNLQQKGTADLKRIYNKINNDNHLAAAKQVTESQRLANLQQNMSIAQAKAHVQIKNLMHQSYVIMQRQDNLRQAGQQKAVKHGKEMVIMQQRIADMQRKANQDAAMAVLKERQLRWKMAREEEAHRQKMRIAEEIHQKRMRSNFYTTHAPRPPAASMGSSRGGMGGGGLGNGLTSRADIYMHANAMRTLVTSGQGLIQMYGDIQLAEAGLRAFTGSAQATSNLMAEIKDHAEKTSFTRLGLAEATRNMMSYGLSAKSAIENMKMLGDVAGGSELRFERLSFAMSQISSNGRLQGNELRQLTEQGFNPLETMSRHTGKSMNELRKLMEAGAISADHVTEALRIETAAGGRFANMQKQMANTLPGVRNQLKETAQNLKMNFMSVIEKDLVNAMKIAIGYLKMFETYLQTPAGVQFATKMMDIAKKVFVAALSFHAMGFAMASLMWWGQSVMSMLNRIVFVFRAMAMGISLLVSIVSSPFALIVLGAIAAGLAIAYVAAQIWGPGSIQNAFLDLYNTIAWFFTMASGFMYNFAHNWGVITAWFLDNWATIIPDMMELSARFAGALVNNIMVGLRTAARLMVVFVTWLVDTWYSMFDGRIFNAMVEGFVKIFTWLEDKWKKFAEFISNVWENLFDPAALYEVINQGMGIDDTASKMTDDIQTTLDKGLFAGIEQVVSSEANNLQTGLEGFSATTPELTGLKFDLPNLPTPPKAPELADAAKYGGPGFGNLGAVSDKDYKVTNAMSATGSDYNKLLAEQSSRMASSKANPQLAAANQTNVLLNNILGALKGAPKVNLQPAAVAGGVGTP